MSYSPFLNHSSFHDLKRLFSSQGKTYCLITVFMFSFLFSRSKLNLFLANGKTYCLITLFICSFLFSRSSKLRVYLAKGKTYCLIVCSCIIHLFTLKGYLQAKTISFLSFIISFLGDQPTHISFSHIRCVCQTPVTAILTHGQLAVWKWRSHLYLCAPSRVFAELTTVWPVRKISILSAVYWRLAKACLCNNSLHLVYMGALHARNVVILTLKCD